MRYLILLSALCPLSASAQHYIPIPEQGRHAPHYLPIWERFDSVHCVLSEIPENGVRGVPGPWIPGPPSSHWPDTLWANGLIPAPIIGFDTVVVDQCCVDPDPPILLARLQRWPRNSSGEFLPLFMERLDADTAAWFLMDEWRSMPDTMIPLSANPYYLDRYVWNDEGLVYQEEQNGKWHYKFPHHLKRSECITIARDSLKLTRCIPQAGYRTTEPTLLLLFVNDKLVQVFQDNRGTGIDGWSPFNHAPRATIITANWGGLGTIILSTGELLSWTPRGWNPVSRETVIYRGECDCE